MQTICEYILFSIILGTLLMVRFKVYRRLCLASKFVLDRNCVNVLSPTGVNVVNDTVLVQFLILQINS